MPLNIHLITRYILKSRKILNINPLFILSDFVKKMSNYGIYGYNKLKRASVATIAPPLVDSKHYNSSSVTPIGVDLL